MTDKVRRWVEAGKLLSENIDLTVACPECNDGIIIVRDQKPGNDSDYFDRYLTCDKCGKWNVVTIRKNH